jgi:tartrate dehydratase alpha subunit/fumarate hydratase class I-like protein
VPIIGSRGAGGDVSRAERQRMRRSPEEVTEGVIVMDVTVLVALIGTPFLVGFAVGMRVEELNLKVRERVLARGRRERNNEPPTEIEPPTPSATTRPR